MLRGRRDREEGLSMQNHRIINTLEIDGVKYDHFANVGEPAFKGAK